MKATFQHSGKYTADRFSIDEVIGALSSQKALLLTGSSLIAGLDENFEIEHIDIFVNRIETSSLAWDFLIEIYGNYQSAIEDTVITGIEGITGEEMPPELEALVTLGTLAVTYLVARYAYDRVMKGKKRDDPSLHISGEGNVIIQNIADAVNQSPEMVEKALGRVDKPDPLSDRSNPNEPEEAGGELVVSRGDAA